MANRRQGKSGKSPTRGQSRFAEVPRVAIQRSVFDRSNGRTMTFNSGELVPVYVDEALPGDTVKLRLSSFGRLATPVFPVMDNMFLEFFFFAVPYRLIWNNWQKFMGEQENPGDSIDFETPIINSGAQGFDEGSVYDHMGIPPKVPNLDVNAFHLRAMNLIWNEWFRSEDLQQSVPVPKGDGPDQASEYKLLRRGKRHDYFTSCLPFAQKGPAVELPLTGNAPVTGSVVGEDRDVTIKGESGTVGVGQIIIEGTAGGSGQYLYTGATADGANRDMRWEDPALRIGDDAVADLSQVTAATINDLREAWQIQRFYERSARGGSRYTETLRTFFGVTSPDQRLQRPEYLGGGRQVVSIVPVQQTSSTDTTSPQGNLSGFGVVAGQGQGFVKSFVEHCVIIGFVCARAELRYQQGLNRMWSRRRRFDYYWPTFANLGEQEVLNKEIYAQGKDVQQDGEPVDDKVFGYQERYAEYRYKPSEITGKMRSTAAQPLDKWHLAQKFDSLPSLSSQFIEENPPVDRVIAVTSEDHFKLDLYFTTRAARPMPMYSVPGQVDHF